MKLPYDPEHSLGFLLNDVTRLLRRDFNRRAQSLGLTQAQWRAIAQLSRNEGLRQVELADLLEVQPITLARLIDRLEAMELVERRPDPQDRRALRLYLTAKANPIVARIASLATDVYDKATAGLGENRREALIRTLRHMKARLSEPEGTTADAARR